MAAGRRHANAFTLVELLVVIAVISTLAALLLPVLGRSLAAARDMLCLNHMKQIIYMEGMYLDEYNGFTQPTRTFYQHMPVSAPAGDGGSYFYWQNYLMPYLDSSATIITWYKRSVSAGGYTIRLPKSVFACPSVKVDDILAMNDAGFRNNGKMAIALNTNAASKSVSRVIRPSYTFLLMDMLGDSGTDQPAAAKSLYSWTGTPMWKLSYGIEPRHGLGTSLNAGFFDGHAAQLQFGSIPDTGSNETGKWSVQ